MKPRAALIDVMMECSAGQMRTSQRGVPYLVVDGFSVCYFGRSDSYKIWSMEDRGKVLCEVETPKQVREFIAEKKTKSASRS